MYNRMCNTHSAFLPGSLSMNTQQQISLRFMFNVDVKQIFVCLYAKDMTVLFWKLIINNLEKRKIWTLYALLEFDFCSLACLYTSSEIWWNHKHFVTAKIRAMSGGIKHLIFIRIYQLVLTLSLVTESSAQNYPHQRSTSSTTRVLWSAKSKKLIPLWSLTVIAFHY